MSHTPGPWRVVPPPTYANGNPWRVAGGDHTIAIIPNRPREANARLIAAAPDLLEALKAMLGPDAEGDVEQAIRAIGKAEGTEAYAEEAARIIAKAEGRNQ